MTPLIRPAALLLDFGGVVVETTRRETWVHETAVEVHDLLVGAGCTGLDVADVELDLHAGRRAHRAWKDAKSRPFAPRETTPAEFWADYVAADWPPAARALVIAHARPLCRHMVERQAERKPRAGIHELLDAAHLYGVKVGIVSNALAGDVHRDVAHDLGLEELIQVQVYSDEVGVRKPNPEMIHIATRALSVQAGAAWYVGDNFDRDVVCGRRAGAGATILMVARGTYDLPFDVRASPDAIVDDPNGLLALLHEACAART